MTHHAVPIGQIRPADAPYVKPGGPPSSYAIAALLEGEPNALNRVLGLTLRRVLFIAPGLFVAGRRGTDLLKESLAASASITVLLTFYYADKRSKLNAAASRSPEAAPSTPGRPPTPA